MSVLNGMNDLFRPLTSLVDSLASNDEEKFKINKEMAKIQADISLKILDVEKQVLQAQSQIVQGEVAGQSWLQRNWRPITMLTFLVLVVLDSFGLLAFRLADEAWTLLQIGLGGYVIGRSVEKVLPSIMKK